ncbi:MAG: aminoacyl-histidine dipeptidase [Acidobacteria bacterium]|nr:MAG: aminoacyl-histidine dipeptidase [Acidobacteriota bacterium]
MSDALKGLQPPSVWKYFGEIARIPRCSKSEEQIARYVVETAQKLGLEAKQDSAGNVLVRKPASPGREGVKTVVLQGHLDMVCEKNAGTVHDFTKDPIRLVRKGEVLMADGTTLGADNGIAVATNLAIMEDRDLEHGPLELLFTIDEETGLTGAANLQSGFLTGKTLLNLDSEEDWAIYVGCAGGRDTTGTWSVKFESAPGGSVPLTVTVKGLKGGHSGLEINAGRGNAIKILNRVLLKLHGLGMRLSKIDGGNKRNAIPREASATVVLPSGKDAEARRIVNEMNETIRAEFSTVEPDLQITVDKAAADGGKALSAEQQEKILRGIAGLPHGVIKMSADVPGLVETSTNVAVINSSDGKIVLSTSQRSSVASEIHEIGDTVASVFLLSGAEVQQGSGYPGWKPNLNSPVLKLATAIYSDLFGKECEVKAVHAGLECGIIGERYPGMDMISFGPTLEAVHSPDEKIHIASVEKFWKFLMEILRRMK